MNVKKHHEKLKIALYREDLAHIDHLVASLPTKKEFMEISQTQSDCLVNYESKIKKMEDKIIQQENILFRFDEVISLKAPKHALAEMK